MLRGKANIAAVVALGLLGGGALLYLAARYNPVRAADVAALKLVDQDGATRSLDAWRGKIVVLDFIYTSCGDTCPIKTAQLAGLQTTLGPKQRRDIQFVSVSVDPEHDDPAALKAYAERTGADLSDWSFLTGNLSTVARFAAAFDAVPASGEEIPSHITTIRLLDPEGRVVDTDVGEPVDEHRLASQLADLSGAPTASRSPVAR